MPGQTDVGVLRWGPGHGGGPLSMPHHSPTPAQYNPVNHPFGAGEMTQEPPGTSLVLSPSFKAGLAHGEWHSEPGSLFHGYLVFA